jgi:hypothetical protein
MEAQCPHLAEAPENVLSCVIIRSLHFTNVPDSEVAIPRVSCIRSKGHDWGPSSQRNAHANNDIRALG